MLGSHGGLRALLVVVLATVVYFDALDTREVNTF